MERHIISNRGLSWSYLIQREHLSRHERIKSLVREARDTNTVVAGSGHKEKGQRCHRSHVRTEQKEGGVRILSIQKDVLRKDHEPEEIESKQRLAEEKLNVRRKLTESRLETRKVARGKMEMAEHHWTKATIRYRGWIPWLRQLRAAKLEHIKAVRVHQYCLTQRMWTSWTSFVQRSRAATTRLMNCKVARMLACSEVILKKRAWRKWHCHQLCLARASLEVRCNTRNAVLSSCWNRWVDAWKHHAIHHYTLNQRAILLRNRRTTCKVIQEWQAAVHNARMETFLADERHHIWGKVKRWLAPQGALPRGTEDEST